MSNSLVGMLRRATALVSLVMLGLGIVPSQGGGGVTGTGNVAHGTVAGFGSVFVNGVEFFTNDAEILVNGVPGSEAQLRVGMAVRVTGNTFAKGATTGQAQSVVYEADLRGQADAAPITTPKGAALAIGGLVALIGEDTVLDGFLGAEAIAAGDRLEVSGIRDDGTGTLRATYVSRREVAAGTVLTGVVTRLTADSFSVGGVAVRRDGSRLRDAPQGLANGMTVRVASRQSEFAGLLEPEAIRVLTGRLDAPIGRQASSEGVVSSLTGSSFSLGGLTVQYGRTTSFREATSADLRNGARVEAEGVIDAAGALQAEKIEFKRPDEAWADATVRATVTDGFVLFSDDGIQVVVNASTRLRDRSRARLDNFGLADVRIGDRIAAGGVEVRDGVIAAEDVTRLDPSGVVALDARARGASRNALSMLSIRVAGASTTYRDVDGSALSADAFFAKAAGRRVIATGVASGAEVVSSSLQISR